MSLSRTRTSAGRSYPRPGRGLSGTSRAGLQRTSTSKGEGGGRSDIFARRGSAQRSEPRRGLRSGVLGRLVVVARGAAVSLPNASGFRAAKRSSSRTARFGPKLLRKCSDAARSMRAKRLLWAPKHVPNLNGTARGVLPLTDMIAAGPGMLWLLVPAPLTPPPPTRPTREKHTPKMDLAGTAPLAARA